MKWIIFNKLTGDYTICSCFAEVVMIFRLRGLSVWKELSLSAGHDFSYDCYDVFANSFID